MDWLALLHVWLPLAIGWFIVHRLSAARDMDKARREMAAQVADDLVEVATSIFLAAQRYHTNKRERENERQLKRALFSLKLSQFPKRRKRWFGCVASR